MKRRGDTIRLAILSVTLIALAIPASAQSTYGMIVGVVADESGALVRGATVTASNTATGQSRTVTTGSQGDFRITNLLPGTYDVSVEMSGFKKATSSGLVVRVNESVRVDFAMQVGELSENVEVTVQSPLLETSSATVGKLITNEKIVELPLNGRDFTQLTLLLPGASPVGTSGFLIGGARVAVTGNRGDQNNYTLDGVNNNETFFKHYGIRPSIDAIQEFKVQTNITDAQYGEAAGANISIAIKSGTNELHGTAFGFVRNDMFDARDHFAPRKPKFRWYQFGGTMGGPIVKNRTFFFVNYEGFRQNRESTIFTTVPTPEMMRGDFSRNVDGTPAGQIYDPLTTRPNPDGPGLIRDPFPGNVIPADRFNPVSLAWQRALYERNPPNLPGQRQNHLNTTPVKDTHDQFTVRIDHRVSDKNNLFARFSYADNDRVAPQTFPGTEVTFFNHFRNLAISDTHVFGPTTLLEVKFGFNEDDIERATPEAALGLMPAIVAAGMRDVPERFRGEMDFPLSMSISGFGGAGLTAFKSGPQRTWQFLPMLTKVMGRHNLKFGADIKIRHVLHDGGFADIRHDRLLTGDPQDATGVTGNAYASFLLGWPSAAGRILPLDAPGCESCTEANMQQDLYHFYVHDDIKVGRNLTVNVGLRYEYTSWYKSRNSPSNSSWFDALGDCGPLEIRLGCKDGKGRFVWAGTNPITGEPPNMSERFIEPDRNNWAPRIGISYLLRPQTTLRAGYSIFYGSNIAWEGNHMRGNWPYAVGQDLSLNETTPRNPTHDPFPPLDPTTVPPSAQHTARRDNVMPYMQQWNFGIQQQLATDLLLEVNYVGSKGTHLSSFLSGNDARPGPGEVQPRRPFPQHLGGFSENRSWATSSYHGLITKIEKRFTKGLTFDVNYAWSKSIDLNSEWGGTSPQDAYNWKASIGVSDFHRKHIFSAALVYLLPRVASLTGVAGKIVNDWQFNAIVQLRSGRFLTPTLPFDNANTGSRGNFQRPNLVGSITGPRTSDEWFNTKAFAVPPRFTFGDAGRNIIEGPGFAVVDMALYKNVPINNRHGLQLRFEAFNVLNRTNLGDPGTSFGTAGFGRIRSSGPARQIQFGLKYLF
jgi:hypothetical protein